MSRMMTDLYSRYGDDATGALEALANVDNELWRSFLDAAAERQYLAQYGAWLRSQTVEVTKQAKRRRRDEPRLFEVKVDADKMALRRTVKAAGDQHSLMSLSGVEGASVLRDAARRDRPGALTTVARCDQYDKIADLIESETARLGRPVSVAEVLAVAA